MDVCVCVYCMCDRCMICAYANLIFESSSDVYNNCEIGIYISDLIYPYWIINFRAARSNEIHTSKLSIFLSELIIIS